LKLKIEHITVERGGRAIIAGLDLTVEAGEAVILTGANGAGKTTLLRAVAGLLPPSQGDIVLVGGDDDCSVAEQCHHIGHANAVKPSLTVLENATFWAQFLGGMAKHDDTGDATIKNALARFGLAALVDIPARFLSAGQTRRLGLARLLLAARPLWLLDEPTVSLDAVSTKALAGEIDRHVGAGGMVIAATHLPLGLATSRAFRLNASTPALAEAP
jgi:heme exporter protein A